MVVGSCTRASLSLSVQVNHQLNIEDEEKIRSSVSNDVIAQAPACPLMSIRANKRDEYVLSLPPSSSSFSYWSNKFAFSFRWNGSLVFKSLDISLVVRRQCFGIDQFNRVSMFNLWQSARWTRLRRIYPHNAFTNVSNVLLFRHHLQSFVDFSTRNSRLFTLRRYVRRRHASPRRQIGSANVDDRHSHPEALQQWAM